MAREFLDRSGRLNSPAFRIQVLGDEELVYAPDCRACMTQPQLLEGLKYESQVEVSEKEGSRGTLPNLQH
jgi:hypothetical protein